MDTTRTLITGSEDGLAHAAAALLASALQRATAGGFPASLMVSGGSSPPPIIGLLAGSDLPWNRITVFSSDERCVPADHPDSTEGMVRRAFGLAGVSRITYIAPPSHD